MLNIHKTSNFVEVRVSLMIGNFRNILASEMNQGFQRFNLFVSKNYQN